MIRLHAATSASDIESVRTLFHEYANSLGVNLDYQGFEEEARDLPGKYAPPAGTLVLAFNDDELVGCVGVRPIDEKVAEMKRLYVRPSGRGLGLGRTLAESAVRFATATGYERMRLDTLPQMERAQALYRAMGFMPIDAYRFSPVPGTVFLELVISD